MTTVLAYQIKSNGVWTGAVMPAPPSAGLSAGWVRAAAPPALLAGQVAIFAGDGWVLSGSEPPSFGVKRSIEDAAIELVSVFNFMTAEQIADVQAGTLTIDVTSAVQAALDSMANGGGVYAPPGAYLVSYVVIKNKNVVLYGQGSSTRFVSSQSFIAAHRPTVWIAADGCTVRGMHFTYKNWVSENLASLLTTRPEASSSLGCHICVGYPDLFTTANSGVMNTVWGVKLGVIRDTTIEDVSILGTAIHAIAFFNTFNTRVRRCNIQQFKGTGIYGDVACPNTEVKGNNLETSGDDAIFIGTNASKVNGVWTPFSSAQLVAVNASDNTIVKSGAKGVAVAGYSGVTISGNVIVEPRTNAILCAYEIVHGTLASSNSQVSGNVLKDCFGGYGATSDGYFYSQGVVAAVGGTWFAIDIGRQDNVVVANNSVSLSSKVTAQSHVQGSRGIGSLFSFKNAIISNNVLTGFTRNNIGPEGAADIFNPVNVLIKSNVFDSLSATTSAILMFVGTNATDVVIQGNMFKSGSPAVGGCAAIVTNTNSVAYASDNLFVLPAGLPVHLNQGGSLLNAMP